MKLKLIANEFYVVSDIEPNIGDWYDSDLGISKLGESTRYVEKWRRKITHSTRAGIGQHLERAYVELLTRITSAESIANSIFNTEKCKAAIPDQYELRRDVDVANIVKGFKACAEMMYSLSDINYALEQILKVFAKERSGEQTIREFLEEAKHRAEWEVTVNEQGILELCI